MYALFATINIRGVKIGSGVVQGVTLAKLAPLLLLVAVGLFVVNTRNLAWPGFPSAGDTARASVMLIFAFLGIESALSVSGEVRNPARTVPRAIFSTLVIVTLLYMAIQFVSQGVLGAELATNTKAPLAETAKRVLGSGGQMLILIGTAISTFGYVAGDILASPRSVFAHARDRLRPSPLALVSEKYHTPYAAILLHSTLCLIFAVTGTFASLLVLATLATMIVYLICCLATIKLQRMNVRTEGAIPFRVPGGPVVPILASLVVIWLMTSSTRQEFIAIAAMLAVETLLYLLMRSRIAPVTVAVDG
jgi:amino acid transporter